VKCRSKLCHGINQLQFCHICFSRSQKIKDSLWIRWSHNAAINWGDTSVLLKSKELHKLVSVVVSSVHQSINLRITTAVSSARALCFINENLFSVVYSRRPVWEMSRSFVACCWPSVKLQRTQTPQHWESNLMTPLSNQITGDKSNLLPYYQEIAECRTTGHLSKLNIFLIVWGIFKSQSTFFIWCVCRLWCGWTQHLWHRLLHHK